MKRVVIVLCCAAMLATLLPAQERTGNISGTVVDQERNSLPGATVTLTGHTISAMTAVANAEGKFRFLSLFPANDYVLKAELQGFKTRTETGVIVNVGKNSDITVVLEQGKLEEQVTVVAQTPVVQAKKVQVTHTVNYDQLQELPSARDPWVVLQMTPAVLMDRENVGGVESGQQSSFASKGSTTQEWTVDGMQITDRNSGGSPGYFDFDSFEEMNISTGMLDVEHRDPGIVINLVTRRGGNRTSLGGRFFYTNQKFQKAIGPAELAKYGISGYNQAYDIKDFGFNAGGPIFKDKIWWWVAYGVQQVQTINLLNVRDDTYLNNYTAKVNFQIIPENRAEVFYQAGDKKKFGRSSSQTFPPGWNQHSDYYFGNPTLKLQDEHMFGDNLFVSIRYGRSNGGFGTWPANDESISKVSWYDYEKDLNSNSETWFYSDRPHPYGVLQVQYFNDNLLGMSHEIKIGGEINNNNRTYTGGWPGNVHVYTNYNTYTVDWNLDGNVDVVKNLPGGPDIKRIYLAANDTGYQDGTKRVALYFNDAITTGRFNLNIGLRVDRATPYINPEMTRALWLPGDSNPANSQFLANYASIAASFFPADVLAKLAPMIPQKQLPHIVVKKLYWNFSPRVGLNYDVFGNGKTIIKAAYSLYRGGNGNSTTVNTVSQAGYLGTGYWTPYGLYGSMNFWWADSNGDSKPQLSELYWADYSKSSRPVYHAFDDAGNFVGNYAREYTYNWNGWDINNPQGLSNPTAYVDTNSWSPAIQHELFLSIEREIVQDFGVSLSYSWKRMGNMSWSLPYYPLQNFPSLNDHVRNASDWMIGGYIPDQLVDPATGKTADPKEAKGKPWYVLKAIPETATTSYTRTVMMDSGRYDLYWGWDLIFNKRLTHRWMLNASFTYQMQRHYYGSNGAGFAGGNGAFDPTGLWAYEGNVYGTNFASTSGKIAINSFSRWMAKVSALYQLPWELGLSGTLSAHEGSFFGEALSIQDRTLPNAQTAGYSNTMPLINYNNRNRLGDVWQINLKLEKGFRIGDTARMYFSADLFNVLNAHPILRRYDISLGTYRFTGGPSSVPYSWTAPAATSGNYNEMMNPLLLRLGMRFTI